MVLGEVYYHKYMYRGHRVTTDWTTVWCLPEDTENLNHLHTCSELSQYESGGQQYRSETPVQVVRKSNQESQQRLRQQVEHGAIPRLVKS